MLSEAFAQPGHLSADLRHLGDGRRKKRSLAEVLDRYLTYQKLTLAVRKKVLVSLMYPAVLIVLVICLMVFLVTYVVPNFAELYSSMQAKLPALTRDPDRGRHHGAQLRAVGLCGRAGGDRGFCAVVREERVGEETLDRVKLQVPLFGEIWLKYQVAQFSRVLSTLLIGGIPLVQALETSADSLGHRAAEESAR